MACDGTDLLNHGNRYSYSFHRFRAFHRIDSSSFELFPLADWNFTLLLHFDADREELVYQEVCALVIALSVYLAN